MVNLPAALMFLTYGCCRDDAMLPLQLPKGFMIDLILDFMFMGSYVLFTKPCHHILMADCK